MASNLSNATAIGFYATVDASDKVRIGNTYVTSIGGQAGWTTFSDGRYKKNIKEDVKGLTFINSLKPITYTVDINGLNTYYDKNRKPDSAYDKMKKDMQPSTDEAAKIVYNGFIAQDVEASAKKLAYNFSGVDKPKSQDGLYGLRYSDFVVPLVKAVQELSKNNDSLGMANDELKKQNGTQQQQIDKQQQQINTILQKLNDMQIAQQACCNNAVSQSSDVNSQNVTFTSAASLEQNVPNPFSSATSIRYTLPQQFTSAHIVIIDNTGKTLKQVTLSGTGKGVLYVEAGSLASGSYKYSLIIDGKQINTKTMVLTK